MSDFSTKLEAVKRDFGALQRAYVDAGGQLGRNLKHLKCPLCGDDSGFMLAGGDGGICGWRCYSNKAGGKCTHSGPKNITGTIIDLIARSQGVSAAEACKIALDRYGGQAPQSATSDKPAAQPQSEGKLHLHVEDACSAMVWSISQRKGCKNVRAGRQWQYTDERGEPLFVTARFDFEKNGEQRKEFSIIRRDRNGWRCNRGPWGSEKKFPLYGLSKIANALKAGETVLHVCEGEKCADALRDLGFVATTSQGGSGRAAESDWTPAARFKRVFIWQDIDATNPETGENPGLTYVGDVAELVTAAGEALSLQPEIVVVDLRGELAPTEGLDCAAAKGVAMPAGYGLQDGEDVYDAIAALKIDGKTPEETHATLAEAVIRYGRRWSRPVDFSYPGQPAPLKFVAPGERKILANFDSTEETYADKSGEQKKRRVCGVLPVDVIRQNLVKCCGGWPVRVRTQGARHPVLIVHSADSGDMRWLMNSDQLASFMHGNARMRFNPKQDEQGNNYATMAMLYHELGSGQGVREFVAVENKPHEPLMSKAGGFPGDHYYCWKPPAGYMPGGEYLAAFLEFFDNARDKVARALIASAVLTPFWGGPYGKRPAFIVTAPDRGCGKTTLVWGVSKLTGGNLSLDLTSRGLDEFIQRRLSPEGRTKRVVSVDNVKGTLSSGKFEALVTDEWHNGKMMYTGDSQTPNACTYFVTANGVRCSRDMAQRSFFIELIKPKYRAAWDKRLSEFLTLHAEFVVADAIAILKTRRAGDVAETSDRWSRWADEVLATVCAHPALRPYVGGVAVADVLAANDKSRDESDEDREEAEYFWTRFLELLCEERKLVYTTARENKGPGISSFEIGRDPEGYWQWKVTRDATGAAFVSSDEMHGHFTAIMKKKRDLSARQVVHILNEHIEAGRLPDLQHKHRDTGNGFEVSKAALQGYVDKTRAEMQAGGRQQEVVGVAESAG